MSAVGARTAREATAAGTAPVCRIRRQWWHRAQFTLLLLLSLPAAAEPWAAANDLLLRHDLQLLNDSDAMNLPLTTWPLSWGDIGRGLADVDASDLTFSQRAAYERVMDEFAWQSKRDPHLKVSVALSEEPRLIRTFEDTPRAEAETSAALSWVGNRFALRLQATLAANPLDGDEARPDGSYVGLALGNWMFSAGWQDRWWGPGRDGSLILSSSARPAPGVAVQRNNSIPFESRWLSWIGPWTLSAFVTQLDDERAVRDTRLFGVRVAFKPIETLEIGLSRTALWCGEDRSCDFTTFSDLSLSLDNGRADIDDDVGNELTGIDLRWRLPRQIPVAAYMQWMAEDTRRGDTEISWLRQVGIETWGSVGDLQHHTHLEISDTRCRDGDFGFGDARPDCAYEDPNYPTGYRFRGSSIGHGADSDSLVYSFGSTLVQSAGQSWNLSVRYMEINRSGVPSASHTVSAIPRDLADIQLSHERLTPLGRFRIGLGVSEAEDPATGESSTDVTGFLQWTME